MSVDLIIEGPVAKIVLNRPEKLNALTHEMRAQLRDYTQQLRFDDNVRAIIVTGEGRAFCTGADVGRMQRGGLRAEREKMQGGSHQFLRTLHATEKPVIAAVRGPTVGIGWSIALACDLIVASETARFSQVFRRIGLAPDGGAIWFLTRRIGLARAKELVFTARFVEAAEALSLGLVNHVVPDGELMAKTEELAADLASRADLRVRHGEEAVPHGERAELRGFPGLRSVRAAAARSDRGPSRRRCGVQGEAEAEFRRAVKCDNLSLRGAKRRGNLGHALRAQLDRDCCVATLLAIDNLVPLRVRPDPTDTRRASAPAG